MLAGCASGNSGTDAGDPPNDAGTDAGTVDAAIDAGLGDAGIETDAGSDSGVVVDPTRFCISDEGCADGACNGRDFCDEDLGVCAYRPHEGCDDGIACTDDTCGEPDGHCVHSPVDSRCPAGQVCLVGEGCGVAPLCAGDEACDDGMACNGTETCDAELGCQSGTPVECADDGIDCTVEGCDPSTGDCTSTPMNGLCPPGEVCVPGTGCFECAEHSDCADGNACNGIERCTAEGCAPGTPVTCMDDGIACTVESCDPATGGCSSVAMDSLCGSGERCIVGMGCRSCTSDAECDDGLYCNGAETCGAAGCQPGTAIACDDGVACTVDACNEATDSCGATPDDARCGMDEACDATRGCYSTLCMAEGCAAGGGDGTRCDRAIVVPRPAATSTAFYMGDTTGDGDNDDLSSGSSDCWDAREDNFYRIYLLAGERLQVVLDPQEVEFNSMLKLYSGTNCEGSGDSDLIGCYNDGSDGRDDTLDYTATADGWYSIVVDGRRAFSDDRDFGRYVLRVTLTCSEAGCCCG